MPRFKVAHINRQGVDLIIIPLNGDFERKTSSDQRHIVNQLQDVASSAGLAGRVIPFWPVGRSGCKFIGPSNYRPFLESLSLSTIQRNINKEIHW